VKTLVLGLTQTSEALKSNQ